MSASDEHSAPDTALHAPDDPPSENGDAPPSWAERDPVPQADIDRLSDRIARLAAHIHAATYRLLELIRRFDAAEGWHRAGFRSCAAWLSWRTGIGPGAARERVRVARALADLPELSGALERGEEAMFRGGADDRDAPAAARRADAVGLVAEAALGEGLGAGTEGEAAPPAVEVEDDAEDAEAGAAEAEAAPPPGDDPDGSEAHTPEEDEPEPAPTPVVGRAGRFEVVVHVSAETLASGGGDGGIVSAETPPGALGASGVSAQTPHVAGGPALSRDTARRLACDAGVVTMLHGRDGRVLDVGRRTRSVPPAMRRALDHRDRGCRFPGCGSRFCDAHHIVPWAEGGKTRLDNLVLLYRHHHRRVHEDGWWIELADDRTTADGRPAVRVHRPDGGRLPPVPPAPELSADPVAELKHRQSGLGIDAWTATPEKTTGKPLDVDFALYALMPPLPWDELPAGGGDDGRAPCDGETSGGGGEDAAA